jgi:hypothetical protein
MRGCEVGLTILDQRILNRLNPMKRKLSTKGIAISIVYQDPRLDESNLHRRHVAY